MASERRKSKIMIAGKNREKLFKDTELKAKTFSTR